MRKVAKLEDFEEGVGADELAFGAFVVGHESGPLHADVVLGGLAGVAEDKEGVGGRVRADAGNWCGHIYLYSLAWRLSLRSYPTFSPVSASQAHFFKFKETYRSWNEQ
jgi:hypothetical protein